MYEDSDYGYTFSDSANSAYDASETWASSAEDAWYAGDMGGYNFMDGQADSWESYGSSMESLASDPTDGSAWSEAWNSASDASNAAWNASVDAYVAGDDMASYELNQYSLEANSTADATWDAWGAATSSDSSYDTSSYSGYDTSSYDTSSYSSYDTSSYDTSSYSSYDSGYDSSY